MNRSPAMVALVLVAVGASFWAGRVTSPDSHGEADSNLPGQRSALRGNERAGRAGDVRGGPTVIRTGEELRLFLKKTNEVPDVLMKMGVAEISALASEMAAGTNPDHYSEYMLSMVFGRWTQIDPEGAILFGLQVPKRPMRLAVIRGIFSTLGGSNPTLARQQIDLIADPALRLAARKAAVEGAADLQPDAYVEWVREYPELRTGHSDDMLTRRWTEDDPAAAAARLKTMPTSTQLESVEMLGSIWAGKDPVAARAWAESLVDPDQKAKALGGILAGMVIANPDAAFAGLESLPAGARSGVLTQIFKNLAGADPDLALARMQSLPGIQDRALAMKVLGESMAGWGAFEPRQLAKALEGLPPSQSRNGIRSQIAGDFTLYPIADMDEALAVFSEDDQKIMRTKIIDGLSSTNPEQAIQMIGRMEPSEGRDKLLLGVITQMASARPELAIAQIGQLPPGWAQDEARRSVISEWVQNSPRAAVEYAESLTGPERQTVLTGMISRLGQNDPLEAVRLYEGMMQEVDGNKDGPVRLVRDLAANWARLNPAEAVNWAAGLPEGKAQSAAFGSAVSAWRESDPAAARQAVEQADLPEEQKQILLKNIDRNGAGH